MWGAKRNVRGERRTTAAGGPCARSADPRDGAPLEIGRTRYRLPETIKRWIRMRDANCTFPGCTNRTPDNETDHLTAWEHGGTTGITNLAQLCPKHHRLKHHSQWTPDPATMNDPPGWTSPTGRHYKPEHPDTEPPQWAPDVLPMNALALGIEDLEWELLLADMPNFPDPPPEEPPAENLLDPSGLCPTDPLREEFYAQPFNLPPDPWKDWERLES